MKKLSALIALALLAPMAYAQDGSSCANAITLVPNDALVVDTSGATGWINTYGPLVSPSNDIVYTFTTGAQAPTGSITPTASGYSFAVYLLNSCAAGAGPTPIGSSATLNSAIQLSSLNPTTQYWVAVTGTAAGGPGANGSVTLNVQPTLPVTLQSFEIN